jgi:glycosidase
MPFNESGRYDFGFWRKAGGGEIPAGRENELGPDDGVWPIELQHPDAYKRRGQIRDFDNYTAEEGIDGDFVSLKDLDLSKPEVLDALIRCYKYWIAIADVDGYRLDTVTHTEPSATAIFCNAIREYCKSIGKDNFFLYAEIVADDRRLRRYVGTNMPTADEAHERYPTFSAVLDFPMYFVLEEVIKGYKTPDELHERYESFRRFYRDFSEAGQYFVTFVDNHDQMSRPYRRFANGVSDHHLSILAVGYLLTNMGIPCVYYGTEQGFDGGGDSDVYVRECMFGGRWGAFDTTGVHFFNPENPVYKAIGRIARVRAREPALRYGREYFRQISGDGEHFGFPNVPGKSTIAFSRVLDVDEVLVCLNLDPNDRGDYVMVDKKLTPPGTAMTDLLNGGPPHKVEANRDGEAYVRVPLMGHRMAILKKEA